MDSKYAARSVALSSAATIIAANLPLISLYNMFFGIWQILGGILSVFLYKRGADELLKPVDGAVLGGLTGLVTGIVSYAFGMFLLRFLSPDYPVLSLMFFSSAGAAAFFAIAAASTLFSCAGGVLGIFMFGRQDLKNEYDYDTEYVGKLKDEWMR